ncbi:ABC transporter permease [Acetivibrio clariflavus]|uniref:Putative ABC-type transport system, permease component n=1 Tax=Acetivibrio clariflavus (strain DSM 19732 / NBRC 101661 / EBR45) TaxID=720554 RepID=G8LZW7_ACECE|nr:ABC transporter permease [Acetivibrio clariflavus]AEV69057.1 putative ABC-type transport system, permease component [Acetivibrio clariflavus DSM 19732]HOQ00517.1 ABC transporter permease [Acetivibrio clariflavus]HPU41445.1 ABC transporter permease [Acetivibrio clariflavus]
MNLTNNILYDMIYHSTPILLAVLGGLFAHKANVLNIGLEGMMLMGAFSSALAVMITGSLWMGLLISVLLTLILGWIFALLSVKFKSNFIITGFGINLFVTALSAFVLKYLKIANINVSSTVSVSDLKIHIPIIKDIPIIGSLLSGHTAITYTAFLLIIVVSIVLYDTKFGVYVRVVGENEEAAKSVGINVNAIKYAAVLIGAALCALAGMELSVERLALFTNGMTAGRGFIAIAAIYCGRGEPLKCSLYAILFGLAKSLAINLALFAGPVSGLFEMVPYLTIVVVLLVVSVIQNRNNNLRGFKLE